MVNVLSASKDIIHQKMDAVLLCSLMVASISIPKIQLFVKYVSQDLLKHQTKNVFNANHIVSYLATLII